MFAAVAAGFLARRTLDYLIAYGFELGDVILSFVPLAVTAVVAVLLTTNATAVILAVAMAEILILVVFVLELAKDYLMMRNVQARRPR